MYVFAYNLTNTFGFTFDKLQLVACLFLESTMRISHKLDNMLHYIIRIKVIVPILGYV